MATMVSHHGVHGVIGGPGPLTGMEEQKPADDVQKDKLSTEGDSNSTESWCYWVPFPGVRYYCYGDHPSLKERVKRA